MYAEQIGMKKTLFAQMQAQIIHNYYLTNRLIIFLIEIRDKNMHNLNANKFNICRLKNLMSVLTNNQRTSIQLNK